MTTGSLASVRGFHLRLYMNQIDTNYPVCCLITNLNSQAQGYKAKLHATLSCKLKVFDVIVFARTEPTSS